LRCRIASASAFQDWVTANWILIPQSRESEKRIGAQVRQNAFRIVTCRRPRVASGEERPSYRSMLPVRRFSSAEARRRRAGLRPSADNLEININRQDTVAASHDAIAVMIISIAVGAASHRDDVARLGHLVVDFAQSRSHLVPATIITSHWRGLDRGEAPKRSKSSRGMDTWISSIAQQAKPNCSHIIDSVRAQVIRSSTTVMIKRLSES
jgi:hypothetical protein